MLARKSTLIVLNSIVGGILGFVALKLIALYMGAGIYGQLAFALSLFGIIGFLGNFGFAKAHTKRVSEGRDLGDCLATYTTVTVLLAGGYIAIVLAGLTLNHLVLQSPFVSTTQETFLIVSVAQATLYLRGIGRDTFEARREAAKSEAIIFTEHVTRVPLMIIFALFYASARDKQGPIFDWLRTASPDLAGFVARYAPESLAIAVLVSAVVSTAASLLLVSRMGAWGRFRKDLVKDYGSFALPTMGASAFSTLGLYTDRAALGFFWSDAVVGRYYGIQRLLSFVTVLYKAVGAMLFPEFSDRHAAGDWEGLRSLTHRTMRYISMIAVPAAFGAWALAEPAIRILLSNDWLPATDVLIILALALPLKGIAQTLQHLLYGMDRPRVSAGISISSSATQIGISLLLIPSSIFGFPLLGLRGVGAAIATLIATGLDIALRVYAVDLHLDPGIIGRLARQWIAGGLMGASVWWLRVEFVMVDRWYELLFFVGVGAAIYFALLFVLREFDEEDWDFFMAALHPGEMATYIKEEVFGRGEEE